MTKQGPSQIRGSGRTAFIARLETIRTEISRGDFLVDIHARHQPALGITYSGFRKLVQRYAEDAEPAKTTPVRTRALAAASPSHQPAAPGASSPAPVPPPTLTGETPHVGHDPGKPSFHHTGVIQEGEMERLLGPEYLKARRKTPGSRS